jgi:glycosyltransferase involved in cell wall biosynthesis
MEDKKKQSLDILMVAPQPFFRARGTPFSVLHRIRALLALGHRVDLITYPFGEDVALPGLTIIRAAKPPLVKDVRIGPSLAKIMLDVPLYFATRRQLKRKKYDVLHSHEEAAFFCVGLARRFGLPHVYDMHSSLPQQLANFKKFNLGPVRGVFEGLERHVLDTCDGVITICADLGQRVDALVPGKRHRMIENTGDDTRVFASAKASVRDTLGLGAREVILYTGTFEAYQGLDLLLEGFAEVARRRPAAHLVLVGGNAAQVADFRGRAAALGLAERVSLVGTVPPTEIPAYLEATDVIVSPRSSGTNTPLKIYGYLRSGVPLVATNIYTHTQTLDSSIAELVPPTATGLAQGIERLLADRGRARALAEAARARALAEFSDDAYINKVAEFYGLVFPEPRARAAQATAPYSSLAPKPPHAVDDRKAAL